MGVLQKGGTRVVVPITQEALEILLMLRVQGSIDRPFPLDANALERLERRMKRFARGFDLDLTTFHSFRHYFASRCLLAGLTVQEVARLLGHSDNGELVLRTYGHICNARLHSAIATIVLASDPHARVSEPQFEPPTPSER